MSIPNRYTCAIHSPIGLQVRLVVLTEHHEADAQVIFYLYAINSAFGHGISYDYALMGCRLAPFHP